MAHYAFLNEDNIVTEVITGVSENELIEGKPPKFGMVIFVIKCAKGLHIILEVENTS